MDNHPIPQDVTGFQFRLIGDMTIKQFAYLAVGCVAGWIFFVSPLFGLIKLPLAFVLASGGIFLAFVPIGGRPADTMLLFFLKALFSPTQYVYQKSGGTLGTTPSQDPDDITFIQPDKTEEKKETKQDKKEEKIHFEASPTALASSVLTPQQSSQHAQPVVPQLVVTTQSVSTPTPIAQGQQPAPSAQLSEEVTEVSSALEEAKKEEKEVTPGSQEAAQAHEKVEELEDQLQTMLRQKEELEKRLILLQQQLSQKKQPVFTPSDAPEEKQTTHVRKIAQANSTVVGAPLVGDAPNLIAGVVKDPRGKVLPNILIEVKDKDGNPVRAFKTNPLGQFASATPVLNGVYTITFEDPQEKQRFDSVEITADGNVLAPLEVISVDQREELRRELFGG